MSTMKQQAEGHNKKKFLISAGSAPYPISASVHISCDWHLTGSLNWWQSSRRSTQPPNPKGPDTTCAQSPSVTVGCSGSWFWDVTDAAVTFSLWGLAGQVLCSGSVLTQRSADLGPPVLPYMFLCRVDADTWCLFCLPRETRCDLGLSVRNCTGYTGTGFKLCMGHNKTPPAVQSWA